MTEQEQERIQALNERKALNRTKIKVDNAKLYAGSPMYFYCRLCSEETDILPENYIESPRKYCTECQQLINDGWSESEQSFIKYENINCPECGGDGQGVYDYYMKRRRRCYTCNGNGKIKRKVS